MAAMLAGFKEASGDAVINISADLQDPVTLIPQMVDQWLAGSEIVICHRIEREDSWLCWRRPKTEPLMRVVPTQN